MVAWLQVLGQNIMAAGMCGRGVYSWQIVNREKGNAGRDQVKM
jgi:uncharacterized protein (DUF488 family)